MHLFTFWVSVSDCNVVFIAVQVRRERFVEELESYQKQVEEFATYGDMNEIQKYLRKSQNLETKLTAAAEKVGLQFGSFFIFLFHLFIKKKTGVLSICWVHRQHISQL